MNARTALNAPSGDVVTVSEELLQQALLASRESPRKRIILPFHKSSDALLHRMLNAMQPGTYVQPHRHIDPPKEELFLVLRGAIDLIVFDADGEITHVITLKAGSNAFGADLAAGRYHTFLVREADTVIYEVKLGPYTATTAKDFAPWAPAENTTGVRDYVATIEQRIAAFLARR